MLLLDSEGPPSRPIQETAQMSAFDFGSDFRPGRFRCCVQFGSADLNQLLPCPLFKISTKGDRARKVMTRGRGVVAFEGNLREILQGCFLLRRIASIGHCFQGP